MSAVVSVKALAPKQDYLVVLCDEVEQKDQLESGLYLPDDAQKVEVRRTGTVCFVGPDVKNAVVGEKVLFAAYAGTTIEIDGNEFDLMQDKYILAGIE